jgi:quercetin dioxygenase-like cupin family protein
LRFVWDDGRADRVDTLVAGDVIVVPPEVLHHVESDGAFEIEIDFHR